MRKLRRDAPRDHEQCAQMRSRRFESRSADAHLVKGAQRIVPVGSERRGAPEPEPLVQTDGFGLINPRFQSQQGNPLLPDMRGQMAQHQPAQTVAAKSGPYVHALDFSVLGAKELNATTAGRDAAMPRHEESDGFAHELLDAVPVPARFGIVGVELVFELGDERSRVGRIGAFRGDDWS